MTEAKVKYYCYRCGELSRDQYLKEKENLNWEHDLLAVNITGREILTTYCCEYHHGRFSSFLKKFIPVVKDKEALQLLKEEIKRALYREIEKLENKLDRLTKELQELENF